MQRKIDKRNVYTAGKNRQNDDFIHLHMSNHYRRILNAKKAVDNSPPYCFKLKRPSTSKPQPTKAKPSQPFDTLPLTDRSLSTNSNKESCWGGESTPGSSRYHVHCIPETQAQPKQPGSNMDLVDRITYDTKNGPAAYCDEGWMEIKATHNTKRYDSPFDMRQNPSPLKASPSGKRSLPTTSSSTENGQKRKLAIQKKLKSSGVKGTKPFSPLDGKIYSKPLKTDAVSKLRSLRVYHPPRRKQKRSKPVENPDTMEVAICKCTKICICDANETVLKTTTPVNPKEPSQASSRDSAYNGGVSSLPESRSPTPDQRRKKECCCCCCEKKQQQQREGKVFEPVKPLGRVGSPRPPPHSGAPKSRNLHQQESFKKMQEDALYVKFIQDITTEILDKNLYTNKALKKVMKKHIKCNIKRLQKDRMLKEVENLRIQLGIPEDKSLLNFETEGDGTPSKFYPIISDSEFVLPKTTNEKTDQIGTQTSRAMPYTINGVTSGRREDDENQITGSETDNGEVISVIQPTKSGNREKRKDKTGPEKTCIPRENSSDDSDRPSDPKKRSKSGSVHKNRKQKYVRAYSTTSSSSTDSDREGKFSRRKSEGCPPAKDSYLGEASSFAQTASYLNKKNRNVSFWKNPDLNRVYEVKLKKTVTRSEESIFQDFPRDKHKNE